jgi:phosphatidylglycerol:prolipoprotein diacylglycerol transferase
MTASIVLCLIFAMIFCKKKKIDALVPIEIFLAIVPLGILSARLFSVIFEEDLTLADYFDFRSGGLSIMGAIIGGALGVVIYKVIKKRSFLEIADIITSVLLLGQALGRWGNFFNSELYGMEIVNSKWQFFPFGVMVNGTWYEALFFYESVASLIGFVIIACVYLKTNRKGLATGLYFVYYGTVRLILESRRQSQFVLKWGSVQVSSLISAIIIVIGAAMLAAIIFKAIKNKKRV